MNRILRRVGLLNLGVLAVLLAFIATGIGYYWYYSSHREYFTQRYFRVLSTLAGSLSEALSNYENVFRSATSGLTDSIAFVDSRGHYTRGFTLAGCPDGLTVAEQLEIVLAPLCQIPPLRPIAVEFVQEPHTTAIPLLPGTSRLTIHVSDRKSGAPTFSLDYRERLRVPEDKGKPIVHIVAEIPVEDLVRTLPVTQDFDVLLLALDDGTVIHQQGTSSFRIPSLAFLEPTSPARNSAGDAPDRSPSASPSRRVISVADGPGLLPAVLGDTEYQAFTQPVSAPFSGDLSRSKPTTFIVAGLVESARLRSDALRISHSLLLVVILFVLLLLLGMPILKLWVMGDKDRLSLTDALLLLVSFLMGPALVALAILDGLTYASFKEELDRQLTAMARSIDGALGSELGRIHAQLDRANRSRQRQDDFRCFRGETPTCRGYETVRRQDILTQSLDSGHAQPSLSKEPYPYFDLLFWVRSDGRLRVNWTKDHLPQFSVINLSGREYVQHPLNNEQGFEPIYSYTSGLNRLVYAELFREEGTDGPRYVAAMETQSLALMRTVTPSGFGYAVLQDDGKVLFHSEEYRNLRENFILETDHNARLLSLLASRGNDHFDGFYLGKGHHFYASPLTPISAHLVLFRDKEVFRTANLEMLVLTVFLVTLFTAIPLLFLLFLLYLDRRAQGKDARWLWPQRSRPSDCLVVAGTNALLGVVLCASMALLAPMDYLWVQTEIVLVSLYVLYRPTTRLASAHAGVGSLPPDASAAARWIRHHSYSLMLVSGILIFAVLPTLGCFQLAFDAETPLLLKHYQQDLVRKLQEREQAVRGEYRKVALSEQGDREAFFRDRRGIPGCDEAERAGPRAAQHGIYADALFETSVCLSDARPAGAAQPGGSPSVFEKLHRSIRVLYNDASIRTGGYLQSADREQPSSWTLDPEGRLVLSVDFPSGATSQALRVVSRLPSPAWGAGGWTLLLAAGTILTYILLRLVQFAVTRMFLLGVEAPHPLDLGSILTQTQANLVICAAPSRQPRPSAAGWAVIDLQAMGDPESWWWQAWNRLAHHPGATPVILDHFDHLWESAEAARQKLRLVEALLREGRRVCLLTSRPLDPAGPGLMGSRPEPGDPDQPDLDHRWASVLGSFVTISAWNDAPIDSLETRLRKEGIPDPAEGVLRLLREECQVTRPLQDIAVALLKGLPPGSDLGPEPTIAQVRDLAEPYYRSLWACCTAEERLALLQFAEEGFLHANNPALRRLLQKGLVRFAPDLRFMNESFRWFVLAAGVQDNLVASVERREGSLWSRVGRLAGSALFLLIAIVFISQPDLRAVMLAVIPALPVLISLAPKLFSLFQRDKGSLATPA